MYTIQWCAYSTQCTCTEVFHSAIVCVFAFLDIIDFKPKQHPCTNSDWTAHVIIISHCCIHSSKPHPTAVQYGRYRDIPLWRQSRRRHGYVIQELLSDQQSVDVGPRDATKPDGHTKRCRFPSSLPPRLHTRPPTELCASEDQFIHATQASGEPRVAQCTEAGFK